MRSRKTEGLGIQLLRASILSVHHRWTTILMVFPEPSTFNGMSKLGNQAYKPIQNKHYNLCQGFSNLILLTLNQWMLVA